MVTEAKDGMMEFMYLVWFVFILDRTEEMADARPK